MFEVYEAKSWISLFSGLILVALGVIYLLNILNMIAWSIPPVPKVALLVILFVSSVYLVIDGFFEIGMHFSFGLFSMLIGLTVAALSVVTVMSVLNVLAFDLSFVTVLVIHILFVLVGILLTIGAFMFG